jgi:hypothetical protein
MFFYVIGLETTMHYISIFYSWLVRRHESIIFLYSYPLQIKKTSKPYLYFGFSSKFVFSNIHIRIRIRFENMKMDMEMALSDPLPPLMLHRPHKKSIFAKAKLCEYVVYKDIHGTFCFIFI